MGQSSVSRRGVRSPIILLAVIKMSNSNHQKMWQELLPALVSCVIIFTILPGIAEGGPRHKQAKLKFQENDISVGTTSDTCKMSEPCGWALYVPGSSPRKIYKYTRNIFCTCSGGSVCSLARDSLQQNSFVFYCRPKETSKFRFPDSRKLSCEIEIEIFLTGSERINLYLYLE